MDFTNPYSLSKNYIKLFELLKNGHEIPCFVDYPHTRDDEKFYRDICRARRFSSFDISFGARGICYGEVSSWHGEKGENEIDVFNNLCKILNVEFIEL